MDKNWKMNLTGSGSFFTYYNGEYNINITYLMITHIFIISIYKAGDNIKEKNEIFRKCAMLKFETKDMSPIDLKRNICQLLANEYCGGEFEVQYKLEDLIKFIKLEEIIEFIKK